jgi:hypothetical protein
MTRARYDWEALKKEFLLGDYKSVQEFARKKNLPVNAHFFRKTKGWAEEKRELRERKERKITEAVVKEQIKQEIDWNLTHLRLWGEFLNILQKALNDKGSIQNKDGKISAYVLEKFANVMEKAQKGQRLALGLDEKAEKDDESLKELIEAIKESTKALGEEK